MCTASDTLESGCWSLLANDVAVQCIKWHDRVGMISLFKCAGQHYEQLAVSNEQAFVAAATQSSRHRTRGLGL